MNRVRGLIKWLLNNIDSAIAVALAILFSTLGVLDVVTVQQSINAALATLAVVAIALMRERSSRDDLEDKLRITAISAKETEEKVQSIKDAIVQLDENARLSKSEIQAITPRYVARDLERAMIDTDRWHYKGGTGTYLRAVTLKQNGAHSLSKKKRRQITIDIIDPTDTILCERYGRYRRSLVSGGQATGEQWTTQRVRFEGYASVLAACYFKHKYGLLNIELGLSSVMSQFRFDISSHYAIITQEDPRGPCLKAEAGSWFYNSFIDELLLSLDQAKRVDLRRADGIVLETLTPDVVREIFVALNVTLDPMYTNKDLLHIIDKAVAAKNPYD